MQPVFKINKNITFKEICLDASNIGKEIHNSDFWYSVWSVTAHRMTAVVDSCIYEIV
jgi:hypothetical protein